MDIEELVEKVRQGDPNSFEPIVRMNQQRMYSFCYFMLGNRQEAEDAVQDIFFKAYRNLSAYRYDRSFLGWLYKIAANHCRTLLSRRKKLRLLMPMFRSEDREKSAEQAYVERAETELHWLAGLSTAEKEILILRVLEDQSFVEIAHIVGGNPASVRKRFERLKKKLKGTKHEREDVFYEHRFELR